MKVSFKQISPTADPTHGSPCSRSSHGVSCIKIGLKTCIVVIGGEHIARTPIEDSAQSVWFADQSSDGGWKWRSIAASSKSSAVSPPPRVAHAQTSIGDKIYIFGGRQGITMDEKPLSDMWVLDCSGSLGEETWSEVTYSSGSSPPEARSFHKMVSIGTNLYVFGGCGASGRLADLHKFDTTNNTWTDLGASAKLRGRGGANLIQLDGGNRLAVVAGFAGEETNDGHIFDVAQSTWEAEGMSGLAELRPRSVCVSAYVPSKGVAVVFGGEVDPSDRGHEGAGGFEDDVVILDGKTGAFKEAIRKPDTAETWPEQRGWSAGDILDGATLYVFGGLSGDDKDPRRLDDLWQCDIHDE